MRLLCLFAAISLCPVAAGAERPVTFERDIQPILTRAGCNAGACHGKARGQNGFQLSLLAFDHDADFAALTTEARGRRVFPASPANSLLLTKGTGGVPHGGGKKLPADGPEYRTLVNWITAGAPRTPADAPKIVRISVSPPTKQLTFRETVALKVTAHWSDEIGRASCRERVCLAV